VEVALTRAIWTTGIKGVNHISADDCITECEGVAICEKIS
jgi:hypothetical protein